jgi:ubiquinone/menaquinone biosynthesis C-methylase UbiE
VEGEEWERLGAWYDKKQGDQGDLWHRTLIDPVLLRVVGDVVGLRVLELACGNGYLARRLTRMGARVTGIDASEAMIARAMERETREPLGIEYQVGDAASLSGLEDASFDLVVCNMALMDIEDAEGAIREVSRVLRKDGRFVASLSHPCFDIGDASAWLVERVGLNTTVWRKVSRYRELHEHRIPWRVEGEVRETTSYHRPLSWYFRVFREARLHVTAFEEPEPTEEFLEESPQGPWIAHIPLHCVIEARKVA